jgi:hypothetical protein
MSSSIDRLINAIANLNDITDNKYLISEEILSEIITPEWHYSNNERIFENININWDSLLESEIVKNISLNFNLSTIESRDIIFEKSFCTWYQPYHLSPRTKWGIHIRYSSWMKITFQLNKECPYLISKLNDAIVAAFLYIYFHGAYHYILENAISRIELFIKDPSLYSNYYINTYLKTFNTSDCMEESLANTYLYKHSSQCHINKEYLKNILINQGNAYADFIKFTENNFFKGSQKLLLQIINMYKDLSNYEFKDLEQFLNLKSHEFILKNQIPIWLHYHPKPMH